MNSSRNAYSTSGPNWSTQSSRIAFTVSSLILEPPIRAYISSVMGKALIFWSFSAKLFVTYRVICFLNSIAPSLFGLMILRVIMVGLDG